MRPLFYPDPLSAASFKPVFPPLKEVKLAPGGGASMSAGTFGGARGPNPLVGGAKGGASETVGTQAPSAPPTDLSEQHTVTLQNQLALTSHMCSQLLYGQNNLIRAVCERLDRPELNAQVEERMAMLQQYQMELEAYYQKLYTSYTHVRTNVCCPLQIHLGHLSIAANKRPLLQATCMPLLLEPAYLDQKLGCSQHNQMLICRKTGLYLYCRQFWGVFATM